MDHLQTLKEIIPQMTYRDLQCIAEVLALEAYDSGCGDLDTHHFCERLLLWAADVDLEEEAA